MSAPERIWASCDTPDARLKSGRWHQSPYGTMYILATPEALAASPEVRTLIAAAEARGMDMAMTDEELSISDATLIARLRMIHGWKIGKEAADRIEALVKERDRQYDENVNRIHQQALAENRAERLKAVLREIAAEASVPVRTKKKGGIKHKWMYRGWRKIATDRIDIARAALKGESHD